ncbi:hypothetical protein ABVT39_024039 [Epinephelus coioides]
MQASLDGGSSSATAPASCQMSKDRAAKKALAGALATMKSFLTGQGTVVKGRIQTETDLYPDVKEKSATRVLNTKGEDSLWRRCFCGRLRKMIQPVPAPPSLPALKTDLRSTLLELVDFMEVEDVTPEHTRNAVSSLSSIHLIPADLQVSGVTWLEFFEA